MATWHVNSNAVGGTYDGLTKATGWRTWAAVVWASINPGDTVNLYGLFTGTFALTKSGTVGNVITIDGLPAGETTKAVIMDSRSIWTSGWTVPSAPYDSFGVYAHTTTMTAATGADVFVEDTNKSGDTDAFVVLNKQPVEALQVFDLACDKDDPAGTVTSATGGFATWHVGGNLNIVSGTNLTPGLYAINSRTSANTIVLASSPLTNPLLDGSDGMALVDGDNVMPDATWAAGSISVVKLTSGGYWTIFYKPTAGTTDGDPNNNRFYQGSSTAIYPYADYITLKNLRKIGGETGIKIDLDRLHDITVDSCWISDCRSSAIPIAACINITISNCLIEYCGSGVYASGVDTGVTNLIIRGNTIRYMQYPFMPTGVVSYTDNHAIGLQTADTVLIEGNDLSYGGAGLFCPFVYEAHHFGFQRNITVRNNFFHDHEARIDTARNVRAAGGDYLYSTRTGDGAWNKEFIQASAGVDMDWDNYVYNHAFYGNIFARGGGEGGCVRLRNGWTDLHPTTRCFNNVIAPLNSEYDASQGTTYGNAALEIHENPEGNLAASIKNNVLFEPADDQCYVTYGSTPSPRDDLSHFVFDYNCYYTTAPKGDKWIFGGSNGGTGSVTYTAFESPGWKAHVFSAGNTPDVHGINLSPAFLNTSTTYANAIDFTPLWNSPLIDAGIDEFPDRTTDYYGNDIYGPPDIGAIEYQPPYDMGTDEVDVDADVRVYGDGKFRNTAAPVGTTADLSIIPDSGNTRHYINVSITTWTTDSKIWAEETSAVTTYKATGDVPHVVGDCTPDSIYSVSYSVDGDPAVVGLYSADGTGKVSFTYSEAYPVVFTLTYLGASQTMGSDEVDIGATVRVLGDGSFVYTAGSGGSTADLSITATANLAIQEVELEITTWAAASKVWTESPILGSTPLSGAIAHVVGDCTATLSYVVWYTIAGGTRTRLGTYGASALGRVSFDYTAGYAAAVTFEVLPPAKSSMGVTVQ